MRVRLTPDGAALVSAIIEAYAGGMTVEEIVSELREHYPGMDERHVRFLVALDTTARTKES